MRKKFIYIYIYMYKVNIHFVFDNSNIINSLVLTNYAVLVPLIGWGSLLLFSSRAEWAICLNLICGVFNSFNSGTVCGGVRNTDTKGVMWLFFFFWVLYNFKRRYRSTDQSTCILLIWLTYNTTCLNKILTRCDLTGTRTLRADMEIGRYRSRAMKKKRIYVELGYRSYILKLCGEIFILLGNIVEAFVRHWKSPYIVFIFKSLKL